MQIKHAAIIVMLFTALAAALYVAFPVLVKKLLGPTQREPVATSARPEDEVVSMVAQTAVRGEVTRAFELGNAELAKHADSAPVVFVVACIALEAGNFELSSSLAAELRALAPDSAESKVLPLLIQARKTSPNGSWVDVLSDGYKRAGVRPDAAPLLGFHPSPEQPITSQALESVSEADAFLAQVALEVGGPSKELVDKAIRMSQQDSDEVVSLAVLAILTRPKVPQEAKAEAGRRTFALLQELATQPGAAPHLRLWAELNRTDKDKPLSEAELRSIESILAQATKNGLGLPYFVIYSRLKAVFEKLDRAQAEARAFSGTFGILPLSFHLELSARLKASANVHPEEGRRYSSALEQLGRAFGSDGTFLGRMIGASYLSQASKLRGDESLQEEADQWRSEVKRLENLNLRWPIAPLTREWVDRQMKGEVKLYRQFLP